MADSAASKAKTNTKEKAAPKKGAAETKADSLAKEAVDGEISSFDDSSGTGYVAVGDEWFPLDLSNVEFGDDHFVNWKPGRKVKATIDNDRVESICVADEYSPD